MEPAGDGATAPVRVGFRPVAFFFGTFFFAAFFGVAFLAVFFFAAFRVEGRLRAALRVFFLAAIAESSHLRQLERCASGSSDRVIRACTDVRGTGESPIRGEFGTARGTFSRRFPSSAESRCALRCGRMELEPAS
jgi:hypothetical protein